MGAPPITFIPSGGMPVSLAVNHSPWQPVSTGGMNVTLVESGGFPVTLVNEDTSAHPFIALYNAMTTKPTEARSAIIMALMTKLIETTIWSKLDVLYLMAAANAQAALLNWKAPGTFTLAAVGGGATFTTDKGLQGNGSSTANSTPYNPTTNGVNFKQDDAGIWVWTNLNQTDSQPACGRVATLGYHLTPKSGSGNMGGRLNDNDTTGRANSNGKGFFGITRPTAGVKRYWNQAGQIGADISVASTGVSTVNSWAAGGAANASWEDNQTAFYALSSGLAGLETTFGNIVAAYMTAIGNT